MRGMLLTIQFLCFQELDSPVDGKSFGLTSEMLPLKQ